MEKTGSTTDVFKISIKIFNDKIGYDGILDDLAFRIWQSNDFIENYPDVNDYMFRVPIDDKGISRPPIDDRKILEKLISDFIHNKFVNSYKCDKGKQLVKLNAFSTRQGSLILTFTLLVVTNIMGYGGARETIDYLVNDANEALKFYLGKDYELNTLIEQESESSNALHDDLNRKMLSDSYNKINLGLRIIIGLLGILIILVSYFLSIV